MLFGFFTFTFFCSLTGIKGEDTKICCLQRLFQQTCDMELYITGCVSVWGLSDPYNKQIF